MMSLFKQGLKLHRDDTDLLATRTHMGQAHFAGTGPSGKTCRECVYYDGKGRALLYYRVDGTLKAGYCHYNIPGKASGRFPHYAAACKMFEQSLYPWAIANREAL
jgi:hypothetical protein